MRTLPQILLVSLFAAPLIACSGGAQPSPYTADSGTTPISTPGTSPSTTSPGTTALPTAGTSAISAPTATAAAPLSLTLFTTYDTTNYNNPLIFTETGTTSCQATVATPNVTCTAVVPEGRLYYSSMNYAFSSLPSACKLTIFEPYSYQASGSSAYTPPGGTAPVDCTAMPIPTTCFGGAAKNIVQGFPTNNGNIYYPDETSLTTPIYHKETVPSANSALAGSNRQVCNDLNPSKIGNTYTPTQLGGAGDGYVPNTYANYTFTCKDDWNDPVPGTGAFTINLFITPQYSAPGTASPLKTWFSWVEAP